ncbi:hypothetical protein [Streptomyces silvisoli]|uniref:hypothetical protein n=1 Tax=Streptomyces silvisoli TaxID=3034235 RepID=UPI0037038FC2
MTAANAAVPPSALAIGLAPLTAVVAVLSVPRRSMPSIVTLAFAAVITEALSVHGLHAQPPRSACMPVRFAPLLTSELMYGAGELPMNWPYPWFSSTTTMTWSACRWPPVPRSVTRRTRGR